VGEGGDAVTSRGKFTGARDVELVVEVVLRAVIHLQLPCEGYGGAKKRGRRGEGETVSDDLALLRAAVHELVEWSERV
jgi:hypothetical protein